jgi:hypothetical protein
MRHHWELGEMLLLLYFAYFSDAIIREANINSSVLYPRINTYIVFYQNGVLQPARSEISP